MKSRRSFLQSAGGVVASLALPGAASSPRPVLREFGYGDVQLAPGMAQTQFEQTQSVLLSLNPDSLLKPWRLRAGVPAPGPDLGGWYDELPLSKTESGGHGFAPGHCFGQWVSALARGYASNRDRATRAKLEQLLALYEPAISGRFYTNFRFPAYNYDKLVIGLIDAHTFAGSPRALELLERTTDAAEPHLPPHALDRDEPQRRWRRSVGESTADDYTWDESYTLPENLYLASQRGGGERYRRLAPRFLLNETYFSPLSEGKDVLAHHHAYSFCNALSSAMQAYLVDGSTKHLQAASNAFDLITRSQSYATGAWGPNESFVESGSGALYTSLTETHRGFETPCGSYAHCKLTRYLLRVTRDGRFGDSMERVLFNTVLGVKPLKSDGRSFYYSDYHVDARKVYFPDAWPCCSGTLPQIAADYRILTYFYEADSLFVNLYLPSTVRWTTPDGAQLALTQAGEYPIAGKITITMRLSRPSAYSLRLRVPAWSTAVQTPGIRVNGNAISAATQSGFATIQRRWNNGDRVELELPLRLRLEAIDPQHPDTVAVMRGPLVLFAVARQGSPIARQQLLDLAKLPGESAWQTSSSGGRLVFRPFFGIEDESYNTYLKVV